MTDTQRPWSVILASLAICLCTTAAAAMVVVPAEFSEMVTASDLVVHGRVVAIRPQIVGNRRTIETVISVAVVDGRFHVDRLVTRFGLRLGRAHIHADPTAGAVVRRHLDRHPVAGDVLGAEVLGLEVRRSAIDR